MNLCFGVVLVSAAASISTQSHSSMMIRWRWLNNSALNKNEPLLWWWGWNIREQQLWFEALRGTDQLWEHSSDGRLGEGQWLWVWRPLWWWCVFMKDNKIGSNINLKNLIYFACTCLLSHLKILCGWQIVKLLFCTNTHSYMRKKANSDDREIKGIKVKVLMTDRPTDRWNKEAK